MKADKKEIARLNVEYRERFGEEFPWMVVPPERWQDELQKALAEVYEYNVAMWLREFDGFLPNYEVSQLTQADLEKYLDWHKELSPKSRNDRRAVLRMFLTKAVDKKYLKADHDLLKAEAMEKEPVDATDVEIYTPEELGYMLQGRKDGSKFIPGADAEMLPIIAMGGLAGLRKGELFRITWEEVWKRAGKIYVGKHIAKTKDVRYVTICPSLAQWLQPYRHSTGLIWTKSSDAFDECFKERLLPSLKVKFRHNGLRHSFCSYHYALHSNEPLTTAQAGHSSAIFFKHYRELADESDGRKWFAVAPVEQATNVVQLPTANES